MVLSPPAPPVLSLVSLPKHSCTESPAVLLHMTGDIRMKLDCNLNFQKNRLNKTWQFLTWASTYNVKQSAWYGLYSYWRLHFQKLDISGRFNPFPEQFFYRRRCAYFQCQDMLKHNYFVGFEFYTPNDQTKPLPVIVPIHPTHLSLPMHCS